MQSVRLGHTSWHEQEQVPTPHLGLNSALGTIGAGPGRASALALPAPAALMKLFETQHRQKKLPNIMCGENGEIAHQ